MVQPWYWAQSVINGAANTAAIVACLTGPDVGGLRPLIIQAILLGSLLFGLF